MVILDYASQWTSARFNRPMLARRRGLRQIELRIPNHPASLVFVGSRWLSISMTVPAMRIMAKMKPCRKQAKRASAKAEERTTSSVTAIASLVVESMV